MKNLSWNLRIVLGLVILSIIFVIGFGISYSVTSNQYSKALELDVYPGTTLSGQVDLLSGQDRLLYVNMVETVDYDTVVARSRDIQRFYEERDYECTVGTGHINVNGQQERNLYIYSRCLLDRSHDFGFQQFNTLIIQPQRLEGSNELTGQILIDVQRQWNNSGFLGSFRN